MKGLVDDLEKLTEFNADVRRVLYTGHHLQLVLMSLEPALKSKEHLGGKTTE